MKKILIVCFGALLLAGCSSQYVITQNNRSQIVAANKPVLKDGAYYYKDGKGQVHSIPAGRVAEVSPASMAEKPQRFLKH